MKDIFIQIREKVVSRMKYIPSFPIDYNAIIVFIGFDRVDQLGQPIQREVDRKNTDYIIFGVPERYRLTSSLQKPLFYNYLINRIL